MKVSDLTNIRDRGLPLLMYVSRNDDSLEVLHIVRREGTHENYKDHFTHQNLTNCNRVLRYASIFTKGKIPSPTTMKLCPRCGLREDFQAALDEYHAIGARLDEESNQRHLEMIERARRRSEYRIDVLKRFHETIKSVLAAILDEENEKITIPFIGVTLTVTAENTE